MYCTGDKDRIRWKAVLPTCLDANILRFVHHALGHLGVYKCLEEIRCVFEIRDLGGKLRRFIASSDVCQRVMHPNRCLILRKIHCPTGPGEVRAGDIYGSLPVSKGNVRRVSVCRDVFSESIKLHALKLATTKACLNKLVNHYFGNVIKPTVVLSDNAGHFRFTCGEDSYNVTAVTSDLHPPDIRRQTRAKGACVSCRSTAASVVMVTTKSAENCCHVWKTGLTTQLPVGQYTLQSN
jgi:hypothetical protein